MIRKLMKHGPSSLTVSLPRKWIDRFGLNKGDEVEIEDVNSKLIVSSKKSSKRHHSMVYDLENIPPRILHDIMSALYKSGIDDIKFINATPEKISKLKDVLKDRMGLEILEESKNEFRLAYLGTSDEESLGKASSQIYWRLLHMLELISLPKFDREEILRIDYDIGRLSSFVQRNIRNKSSKDSFIIYEQMGALEVLGDSIKQYSKISKIDKEVIFMVKGIVEKFRVSSNKSDIHSISEIKMLIDQVTNASIKKGGQSLLEPLENLLQINIVLYLQELQESERNN